MKLFDKKELSEKSVEDVHKMLDEAIKDYVQEVSTMEMDQLADEEKKIMEEMDKIDKDLDTVEYDLPTSVEFDGNTFSKDNIEKEIIYFLGKNEVEWSYTLGCYQLVKFWKNSATEKVPYKVYDSTLRLLNTVKFKGFTEWQNILAINEYLSSLHESYTKDTALLIYFSSLHNALLDRSEALKKLQAELEAPEATPETQA